MDCFSKKSCNSLSHSYNKSTLIDSRTLETMIPTDENSIANVHNTCMEIEEKCNILEDSFRPVEKLSCNIGNATKKVHLSSSTNRESNYSFIDYINCNGADLAEHDNDESTCNIIQKSVEQMKYNQPTAKPLQGILKTNSSSKTTIKQFSNFMFNPKYDEEVFEKHLITLYKDLTYVTKGLKQPVSEYKARQVILCDNKEGKSKKTLFLDLDDTLIHTCSLFEDPEYVLCFRLPEGNEKTVGLNIRPHCTEFLQKISNYYEIFIFTASAHPYAEAIVDLLDPNKLYIDGILSREHCLQTKHGCYIKDLRIIKNRDLKNIVLVDDIIHSFAFQINNGIPILRWNNQKDDKELKYLYKYLVKICTHNDLRESNKNHFNLDGFCKISYEKIVNKQCC